MAVEAVTLYRVSSTVIHKFCKYLPTFRLSNWQAQILKRLSLTAKNYLNKEICDKYAVYVDFTRLEKEYSWYLEHDYSANLIVRQFQAIHYAWAVERGYRLDDIKTILWHPHRLDATYIQFFNHITNKKIGLCCRSQTASLISTYKHWTDSKAFLMPAAEETNYF